MSSLFLVPVDEPSFRRTLESPIDLTPVPESDRPDGGIPDRARVWGVRTDREQGDWERNRRNWNRMESGDALLFYRNSESRYTASGRVGRMFETEYVRDEHWEGGPATSVFTVKGYNESPDLDTTEVNSILGYKEGFYPQGLWRVTDDRPTDRLLTRIALDADLRHNG
ncbi:hypothetical protein [Halorussus caseinilyticus]|uniref:EVE domain-containing protein n=1 Tax=Halorussus caseinilyticus TaxID=3034025 RepID=A0ABD5WJ91_9EURY|nr:hypothetical protein [Halorussus sp. DT72]